MKMHVMLFTGALVSAPLSACSDDAKPSGDTIVDTTGDVDTADGTPDTTADTAGDTTADTAGDTAGDTTPDTITPAQVVLNEIAAAGEPADWIELHNPGTTPADISGWLFRDDDELHAYLFPAGSVIPAGGYKVVERGETGFDFGLGGADAAFLYDASEQLVDTTSWFEGDSPIGRSWGRIPNGTGAFKTLVAPTPGAVNVDNPAASCPNGELEGLEVCDTDDFGGLGCASFGWGGGTLTCLESCTRIGQDACTAHAAALVINEVESDDSDRIELFNGTAATIDLSGYVVSDASDNTYTIGAGTELAAGAYLVLTRDVEHLFGLGDADSVTLKDAGGAVIDTIAWTAGLAIPSYCRSPNGTGGFRTCDDQSFGNANF